MKLFLGIICVFAVMMLVLNLSGIRLSPERGTAGPRHNAQFQFKRQKPPPIIPGPKQTGTAPLVLYFIGGICLLALAWWLSRTPRVLGAVSLPLAGYLAYGQIFAPSQNDAVAIVGLFLAIATGLSQLRGK